MILYYLLQMGALIVCAPIVVLTVLIGGSIGKRFSRAMFFVGAISGLIVGLVIAPVFFVFVISPMISIGN
jgi:hypothetical protein